MDIMMWQPIMTIYHCLSPAILTAEHVSFLGVDLKLGGEFKTAPAFLFLSVTLE